MAKVAFQSSKGLLKQIITRQAGDWKKGVKELVQNSIDSANEVGRVPGIEMAVSSADGKSELVYLDNGAGIGGSIAEVKRVFAIFGDSAKAGKAEFLGKFGIGRGQSISMIYDADSGKLNGTIEIESFGKQWYRLFDFRVDDEELGFQMEGLTVQEGMKGMGGTRWKIVSNDQKKFNEDSIRKYLEKEFVLAFPIYLNKKPVQNKPDGRKLELEDAVVYVKDSADGFELYERGLRVRTFYLFKGFSGKIVTKKPLNLNFARNDVIEDERWRKIREAVIAECVAWFERRTEKTRISDLKATGLVEQMIQQPELVKQFSDVPIVTLADGNVVSLDQIKGKTILTAERGSRVAEELMDKGAVVLDRTDGVAEPVMALLQKQGQEIRPIEEVPEGKGKVRMWEVDATAEEAEALGKLTAWYRKAVGLNRALRVGESHWTYAAWTDGSSRITIRRQVLRTWMENGYADKDFGLVMNSVEIMAHELAHDDDNSETDVHGPKFYEGQVQWLKRILEVLVDYGKAVR